MNMTADDGTSARERLALFICIGGAALWCVLIIAAPLLRAAGWSGAADFLYYFFSRLCHQMDARSFHVCGEKFAVCIRCSTLYAGFTAGCCAYALVRRPAPGAFPSLIPLAAAGALMMLDVVLASFGFHASTWITRSVTGSILGAVLPFYMMPALLDAVRQRPHRQPQRSL